MYIFIVFIESIEYAVRYHNYIETDLCMESEFNAVVGHLGKANTIN